MRSLSSILILFVLQVLQPAAAAAASPLFVRGPVPVPAGWMLPSPGLRKVLYATSCAPAGTVLSTMDISASPSSPPKGEARQVAGSVDAAAWVDDQRYLVLRVDAAAAHLELIDAATGDGQRIDDLPAAPPASWARWRQSGPCGPAEARYGIWAAGTEVAVTARRSETDFAVWRYTLSTGPVPLVRRATHLLGFHKGPPRQRLWQVLPAMTGDDVVLLWRNQAGQDPAVTIDLETPLQTGPELRTLGHAGADLETCQLSGAGMLVCQSIPDAAHARLWALHTRAKGDFPAAQLAPEGSALAYGLSPDGRLLAYVGAQAGPLVVQDLQSGARWQATLPAGVLGFAVTQPEVYLSNTWAQEQSHDRGTVGGQALVRGACGDTSLAFSSEPSLAPDPAPALATAPPPVTAPPSPPQATAAPQQQSTPETAPLSPPQHHHHHSATTHRAGRSSNGYWTPRY